MHRGFRQISAVSCTDPRPRRRYDEIVLAFPCDMR